jgi:hypothetical protein
MRVEEEAGMNVEQLAVKSRSDLPLREISGLGQRRPRTGDGLEVLAVGDEEFTVVAASRPSSSREWNFEKFALEKVVAAGHPSESSEWEAADGDSTGRVFILQESPGKVFVLSPRLDELELTIDLRLDSKVASSLDWADSENSQGEGLVLLRGGHLLVAKEKDPPLLMEFGPPRAQPEGVAPELLFSITAQWPLPQNSHVDFSLLKLWEPDVTLRDRVQDISDVAVGPDDRLYLLSDESCCIARLEATLTPGEERLRASRIWELPEEIRQPEGLVITDQRVPIVAVDRQEAGRNLFVLEPLPD